MNDDMEFAPRPSSDFWFCHADIDVIRDTELTPRDIQVFCLICTFANRATRSWVLKISTLAETAGCGETTIHDSIKRLLARGVIRKEERFKDGRQLASCFYIVGHNAPCYQSRGSENRTPPENRTPGGSENRTPSLQEPLSYEIKDTLTGGEAAAVPETGEKEPAREPQKEERFPISEAPQVFRQTAEYLLLKTGRKALKETEISALRTLNARHQPARVQLEIDKAVERYGRLDRPLASLDFVYIAESLKRQTSRPQIRGQRAAPVPRGARIRNGLTAPPVQGRQAREVDEDEFARLEAKFSSEGGSES
ncbi:MAG: hypothetical protein IJR68_05590 [Fretibacterium sp.]|nr:hypothetical protein [Fretibacterium sp.]